MQWWLLGWGGRGVSVELDRVSVWEERGQVMAVEKHEALKAAQLNLRPLS